jgi:branched-chain amino acid transport system permease protein
VTRTRLGLCLWAALENPALACAAGISTDRISAITFSCGAALADLAGALLVPLFSVFADLVLRFLMQGFLAVLVGGLGTVAGPVFGAGVGGVITAAFPWFLNPVLADVLVVVVAIMLVTLQPAGLLSQRSG